MKTLGIDISSKHKGTAACEITWHADRAIAIAPCVGCKDDQLDQMIATADVIGIDAPFGWPEEFAAAVADWTHTHWDDILRKRLCFRVTDLAVQKQTGLWPLSVAADRIALPAMRAFSLLQLHNIVDRSGTDKFEEVYPAGSLKSWNLTARGYKGTEPTESNRRNKIVADLRSAMPWLEIPEECAADGDSLDALIASLSARAASQGLTLRPQNDSEIAAAKREGWIHLPTRYPTL